jgi:hypothetical protein
MNAFEDACRIEADGLQDIVRFLDSQSGTGRVVLTDKGNLSAFLQETVGDAVFNCPRGHVWGAEFKIEKKWTGNVFLETWSNLSRKTPGWMIKQNADILLYYFLSRRVLYSIDFRRLCRWAFGDSSLWTNGKQPKHSPGRIYDFPEKRQNKRKQRNDTWGRCVPHGILLQEVGMNIYHT